MPDEQPKNMPEDEVGDYIQANLDDANRPKVISLKASKQKDGTWTVILTTQ